MIATGKNVARHAGARDTTVVVRPFTTSDVPLIYKWITDGRRVDRERGKEAEALLEELYQHIAASDFVNAFMLLEGTIPICAIDVCKASQDVISLYTDCHPGDYLLSLTHGCPMLFLHGAMRMAVGYFFTYPEVGRLLVQTPVVSNEWHHLLTKCGFSIQAKIQTPFREGIVYCCTRTSYREAI